jgi:hypothetical protein
MGTLFKIGNKILKIGDKILTVSDSPVPPSVFDSFYFLTYFQRANSISGSGSTNTNVRYYEKGVAKEAGYTDNPTRFTQGEMLNTDFGSFKCSYDTEAKPYAPSNWTTYQIGVPFTQDMANALATGAGLQMEYIFRLRNTSLKVPSGNYARYMPAHNGNAYGFGRAYTIPRQFSYGGGYGYETSRACIQAGADNFVTDFSSLTNGWVSTTGGGSPSSRHTRMPSNTTLGTTPHHVCFTLSKQTSKLRIWLDGVLSGDLPVDMTADSVEYINSVVGNLYHGWQICNVGGIEITQLGYREAVWTEARNYTPPTQAYLAVEDYF